MAMQQTPESATSSRPSPAPRLDDDVARAHGGLRSVGATPVPPSQSDAGRPRRWQAIVRRYGWRAYAVPVLLILTVGALIRGGGSSGSAAAVKPKASSLTTAAPTGTLQQQSGSAPTDNAVLEAASLPAGPAYDTTGDGTFRVLPGTSPIVGTTGQLFRYSIDVENGLTGVDLNQFQQLVVQTLSDPRSWSGHGVRLERVDSGPIDFHITMTSSMTVRKFCGYTIQAESSCYAAAGSAPGVNLPVNRVFFNDARWIRGAAAYVGDLAQYRLYMINHEDGHALGHIHAHECLSNGMAPAMMQQSFGLKATLTGKFCTANPWPYPAGATDAPGAEQPDTQLNNEYGRGD